MLQVVFTKYSRLVLLASLASLPFTFWATLQVIASNRNNVEDWLPSSFPEIQELAWFQKYFKGDEVLVVSWPGCTTQDERLDLFEDRVKLALDSNGRPIFHKVLTGRSLLRELTGESIGLTANEAADVLSEWLIGPEDITCAILMVDPTVSPDRHAALSLVKRVATEDCKVNTSQLKVGGPTADSVFIDAMSVDSLCMLSCISVALGAILAWCFLGNLTMAFAAFSSAMLAEFYILSTIYLSGTNIDAVLTIAPSLVYVLAICASIHFLNAYREAIGQSEHPQIAALLIAWKPTFLASVTTALGLASLMVSELVPIQKFGFFGALGILISIPVLFIYLVAFLTVFPCVPRLSDRRRSGSGKQPIDSQVSAFAVNHPKPILIVCGLLLVIMGVGAWKIKTSAKVKDMFHENSVESENYRWLERNIGSLVPIDVVICFGPNDTNNMLERAGIAERVCDAVSQVPYVSGLTSPSSFLPDLDLGSGMRGVVKRAIANKRLVDQRSRLLSSGLIAESPTEELWLVSGRIPIFCQADYSQVLKMVDDNANQFLRSQEWAKGTDVRTVTCGGVPVFNSVQRRLMIDLQSSLGVSLVTIGGLLALSLRSVWAGILLIIPNVLPILVVFGIMGWQNISVDIGSMLTISTALGISVDNELHFMAYHRRKLCEGLTRQNAIFATLAHCGRPTLHSAIICSLGMLVLTLSPFLPTNRFGWIMCILILTSVLSDLIVLPALMSSPFGALFNSSGKKNPERELPNPS